MVLQWYFPCWYSGIAVSFVRLNKSALGKLVAFGAGFQRLCFGSRYCFCFSLLLFTCIFVYFLCCLFLFSLLFIFVFIFFVYFYFLEFLFVIYCCFCLLSLCILLLYISLLFLFFGVFSIYYLFFYSCSAQVLSIYPFILIFCEVGSHINGDSTVRVI